MFISYTGNGANDVVLFTVPEPASFFQLIVVIGFVQRWRRHSQPADRHAFMAESVVAGIPAPPVEARDHMTAEPMSGRRP